MVLNHGDVSHDDIILRHHHTVASLPMGPSDPASGSGSTGHQNKYVTYGSVRIHTGQVPHCPF